MTKITIPAQDVDVPSDPSLARVAEDTATALANVQGALDRLTKLEAQGVVLANAAADDLAMLKAIDARVAKLEGAPPVVTPPPVVDPPPVVTPPVTGVVAKIVLTPASPATVAIGGSVKMSAKATDASGNVIANPALSWSSSDPSKMSVAQDGTVTGLAAGTNVNAVAQSGGAQAWTTFTVAGTAPAPTGKSVTLNAVPADSVVDACVVDTHVSYFDQAPYGARFTQTVAALVALGVRYFRDGFDGGTDVNKNAQITKNLKALGAAGLKGIMVIAPLADKTGKPDLTTSNVDLTVAALGPALYAFEGCNEVDNNNASWGGLSAYVAKSKAYMASMYAHAKQVAPAATKYYSLTVTGDQAAKDMGDVSVGMDAVAIHPYPDTNGFPSQNISHELQAKAPLNAGHIPWIATETGYHTAINNTSWKGVSEATQAKYGPRLLLEYLRAGITKACFYQLADGFADAGLSNPEAEFGFIRFDGTLRPLYTTMQRFLSHYADVGGGSLPPVPFTFTITAPVQVHYHVAMTKAGKVILALWQEVQSFDTTKKADITVAPVAVALKFNKSYTATGFEPWARAGSTSLGSGTTFNIGVNDHVYLLELT